jgi:hypothetical protein
MWINILKPKTVLAEDVKLPIDRSHVTVTDAFFDKFWDKLGEIYCIFSNIQRSPENIVIDQGIPKTNGPLVADGIPWLPA